MLALSHECIRGPTSARERRCIGWSSCQYTGNKERLQRVGTAFIECLTRRKRHSAVERKIDPKADGGRQLFTRQCRSASLVPEIIPPSLLLGLGSTVAAAGVRVHVVGLLSSQAEQTREHRPARGSRTPRALNRRWHPGRKLRRHPRGTGQEPWD
jgi:hypothetical protein